MDTDRAYVVHNHDGMDEVGLDGATQVHEVCGSALVRRYPVEAEHFGLDRAETGAVRGGDPAENAEIALRILDGERMPGRDVVVANAALGILVAGKAASLMDAAASAAESIDSGRARTTLNRLVEFTQQA